MTEANTFIALDSLSANEFRIELDGEPVTGIFSIAGFQPFQFINIGQHEKSIVLTKMVQRDAHNPFNTWLRESIAAINADAFPTRTLAIVAVDDDAVVRRWLLHKAWLANVSYSAFDSASTELVQEIVQITYDNVEIEWAS